MITVLRAVRVIRVDRVVRVVRVILKTHFEHSCQPRVNTHTHLTLSVSFLYKSSTKVFSRKVISSIITGPGEKRRTHSRGGSSRSHYLSLSLSHTLFLFLSLPLSLSLVNTFIPYYIWVYFYV